MNSFTTITSFTSPTSVGAGRQFPPSTLPVPIEAADILTGSNLKRVRTVNGKVGQDVLERLTFHTAHANGGPSDLKRVRTINKKGGKMIIERRKARTTSINPSEPALPSTPKRHTHLSSPPPLEYKTRTCVLDTRSIEPIKLFYGPLFEGRKKACVQVLEVSYVPRLWAAVGDY